jgi:Na+-transporting methylmalonyl-CoA/oxaloacetate decarboxylase gamma subunit
VTQNLLLALQITAIGMGLVFGSIILFWLMMAALVRLTRPGVEQPPEGDPRPSDLQENLSPEKALRKRRVAVAAVAIALARQSGAAQLPARPASPTAQASAWQVVQRAKSLRIFPRGPVR